MSKWIVCAACKFGDFVATGPRHFDDTMFNQSEAYYNSINGEREYSKWEQGFIDQFGNFYNREEAMKIVKENGQPFDIERNGQQDHTLYSEGLY